MPGTHDPGQHTAAWQDRRVASGVLGLAVREYAGSGEPSGQSHVVLVHGYPDNQEMWRPVAERLLAAGMHVITYDVRGAGGSDVPADTAGYHTDRLVDDLLAVLDATVPDGAPVHLVGHDWGSVQLWEAVLSADDDPRLRGRIATFTSVSGPALDHLAYLARHPEGRRLRLLRQLGHSWYVYAFHVPVLPELVWRTAHGPIRRFAGRVDAGARREGGWGPELGRDAANGVNLYRANVLRRIRRPLPRHTDVPVLVVAPRRDPFLTSVTVEDLDQLCSDVRVERPDTGHWVPRSDPALLADLVTAHVHRHG
jgi:pimeloyl-ACP methyl ester carboxylesterase